jgi:hypothetical protein
LVAPTCYTCCCNAPSDASGAIVWCALRPGRSNLVVSQQSRSGVTPPHSRLLLKPP